MQLREGASMGMRNTTTSTPIRNYAFKRMHMGRSDLEQLSSSSLPDRVAGLQFRLLALIQYRNYANIFQQGT